MKFVLASVGSAGDAHPYIALGQALRARGHDVAFFSNNEHQAAAQAAGLAFLSAGDGLRYNEAIANPHLWHPVKGMGVLWRHLLAPSVVPLYNTLADLHRADSTLRVLAGPQMMGARLAQAQLGLHLTSLYTSPAALRSAQAPTTIAHTRWPSGTPAWLLRSLWRAVDRYKLEPMARTALNAMCTQLDIAKPPQDQSLFGQWMHSPTHAVTLYPAWFAPHKSDLPRHLVYGDFPQYNLDNQAHDALQIASEVASFCKAGSKPVAVMFGTAMAHAGAQFAVWQEALTQLGLRGVFLSQHEAQFPAQRVPHILVARYAPFAQLLPHCAALVHHGGIGSCAQALAAGIPQIIQPCAHDQFENARCVAALNAGQSLKRDAQLESIKTALMGWVRTAGNQTAANYQQRMAKPHLDGLCIELERTL